MREFLPQEIDGSLALELLLDAIYGADRITKGNGTYVETDSDRRQDRPSTAKRNRAHRSTRQNHVERRGRSSARPLRR